MNFSLIGISLSLVCLGYAGNIAYERHSQLGKRQYRSFLSLCPVNTFYDPSILGHENGPRCLCSSGYLHLPLNEVCHLPYRRGPCQPGHYIRMANNETVGQCDVNPCVEDNLVPYNGSCHRIGLWEEGPCVIGGLVTDPETFQLKCITEVASPLRIVGQLHCSDDTFLNTFKSQDSSTWKCECVYSGHLYFPMKHGCYKPYRQGPCQSGSYFNPAINKTERRCIVNSCSEDGLVPYNGSCYKLAIWGEGPCKFGGLVVDPSTLQLKCFDEIEESTTSKSIYQLIKCPETMLLDILHVDRKSWKCRCMLRNHLYVQPYKSCHYVYKQGPCPTGQYVSLALNETIGKCVVNPCPEDNMVLYKGSCYKIELWGEGPCNIGGLIIDQETFQPMCIDELAEPLWASDQIKCSGGRTLNTSYSQDLSIWKCECEQPGYFFFPSEDGCYQLYRQGPCSSGHYVILTANESQPRCVINSCSEDGLVPYNGTCHKYALWGEGPCNIGGLVADRMNFQLKCVEEILNLWWVRQLMRCPHGMILRGTTSYDPKTWYCDCPSYNQLYFPIYKSCFKVYNQGPCPPGYYVYRAISETVPHCTFNPCHKDGLVPYNGTCYELGSSGGICRAGTSLQFRTSTFQLECVVRMRHYNVVSVPNFECPSGTQRDQHNLCRFIIE